MRYRTLSLISLCVLAPLSYGAGRLAAQTQAPQTLERYNVVIPQALDRTSVTVWLPQPATAAQVGGYSAVQWQPEALNQTNRQRIAANEQNVKVQEEAVRNAQRRLDAERGKLSDIQHKLGGIVTDQQRAALLAELRKQSERIASRQTELLQQQTNLAVARANLQQARQPLQLQAVPTVPSQPVAAQPRSRNLLFTPEDAATVKLFHPLLTPDVKSYVLPLTPQPQSSYVPPHK
jgi:hypothetical protein